MILSAKALAISPSPTLTIDAKAKQLVAEGVDVIGFGAGEPDFDTPEHIKEAAIAAIRAGFTKYTPAQGTPELQKAVCHKLLTDNNLSYTPDQIIVSNGAKHSLSNVFAAILNPGDEVLIPAPYWVSYPEIVRLNDGIPVSVATGAANGFKATASDLERALSKKTKALVLNSPGNPTGQVYSRAELQEIAAFAVARDLFVVSDEIYEPLIYTGQPHISIASLGDEIKDLTIIVNGVSKTYAMTGWRIGYTASRREIAKVMAGVQSHATSNPNSIAQKAAVAALLGPQDCVAEMKAAFARRRDYMVKKICSIPGLSCIEPAGAFYAFVDVSSTFGRSGGGRTITSSDDFAALLLEQAQVAVVPGTGFGAPAYVRLSYALAMEQIEKGLERLSRFIGELT
jgi:aspartate aminotransferase